MKCWHCVNEQKYGEDYKMKPSKGFGYPLVISREAAKPVEPAKATFHGPPARQQNKALFCFRQLDHLQLNALIARGLRASSPVYP
jgi:hypothetical protein